MTGTGGSAPFDNHGSIVYKTRAYDAKTRSSHIFYTGRPSAERVRIDHNGNVGIGTASPGVALEVIGDISGSSTSTGSFGRVEATSISASLYQGQIGSRYVHPQTSDSTTWTINHNIGHKYPVVTVYDTSDQMILPETGTATDSDRDWET